MQLYQKLKTISGFFIGFLKSTTNSDCFQKKNESPSSSIFEVIGSEIDGYLHVKKVLFQATRRQSTW